MDSHHPTPTEDMLLLPVNRKGAPALRCAPLRADCRADRRPARSASPTSSARFMASIRVQHCRLQLSPNSPVLAAALSVVVLVSSALCCAAIDPLPPELEHAPLAAQSAWRERMGRESKSEKEQVARQRDEQRTSYKAALALSLREDASARIAATRGPVVQASSTDELWAENSTGLRWVAIVAGLCGIGYVARRALTPAGE